MDNRKLLFHDIFFLVESLIVIHIHFIYIITIYFVDIRYILVLVTSKDI